MSTLVYIALPFVGFAATAAAAAIAAANLGGRADELTERAAAQLDEREREAA